MTDEDKDKNNNGRIRVTRRMSEAGRETMRIANLIKGADADDGWVATAIYLSMEAARTARGNGVMPDPLVRRYSEIEVAAAFDQAIEAWSERLNSVCEPAPAEWEKASNRRYASCPAAGASRPSR